MQTSNDNYWLEIQRNVDSLKNTPIKIDEIPERSNELSTVYGLRFTGVGDYPLFAYLSIPINGSGLVPLFQVPGYGSVAPVPSHERRSRYVIMSLCHRGQRLSDSIYKASYPGLLTDGLPNPDEYKFKDIVADCLRGIAVLLSRSEIDDKKLAIVGNDLAARIANLSVDVKTLMVISPLLFCDLAERLTGDDEYPLQEYNDFQRGNPDKWSKALETLNLFDPIIGLSKIKSSTLIACSSAEKPAAQKLSSNIDGGGEIYINTGYGYLDHKAQEEWLADNCGVERSSGPFLKR